MSNSRASLCRRVVGNRECRRVGSISILNGSIDNSSDNTNTLQFRFVGAGVAAGVAAGVGAGRSASKRRPAPGSMPCASAPCQKRPAAYTAASAWSRSASRSAMRSMPTHIRTVSSLTPEVTISSAESCRWVVDAGWVARLLQSPMLTSRVKSCSASRKRAPAVRPSASPAWGFRPEGHQPRRAPAHRCRGSWAFLSVEGLARVRDRQSRGRWRPPAIPR